MRVLVTRPKEDAERFAAALKDAGHEVITSPALNIVPLNGPMIDLDPATILLITSANAIRTLATRTSARENLVLCVGSASAETARTLGFVQVEASPNRGVEGLIAWIVGRFGPSHANFFYPSAADTAGDLQSALTAHGFTLRREVIYRADAAATLSPEGQEALRRNAVDCVAYFSARSVIATIQAASADGFAGRLTARPAICLSAAIAAAAGRNHPKVVVAENISDTAMIQAIGAIQPID